MNVMLNINVWFLVSLCLISLLIGGLLFGSRGGGRGRM
jgi:hypothetical protein